MRTNRITATGHLKIHKSSIHHPLYSDTLSGVGLHLLGGLALTAVKTTKVQQLLTSEHYVGMFFCKPELCHHGINPSSVWFQQDGATAHTGRTSMSVLQKIFPQHFISCGSDVPRPAHSSDLSTCDYFLWG
jgi:hypothetical protein